MRKVVSIKLLDYRDPYLTFEIEGRESSYGTAVGTDPSWSDFKGILHERYIDDDIEPVVEDGWSMQQHEDHFRKFCGK
jgi:hypothetical protein